MDIEIFFADPLAYVLIAIIFGLMHFVKWLVEQKRPDLRNAAWFKAFVLSPLPLVMGVVIMFVNDVFGTDLVPGDGFGEESMGAIMAGALAILTQRVTKRR